MNINTEKKVIEALRWYLRKDMDDIADGLVGDLSERPAMSALLEYDFAQYRLTGEISTIYTTGSSVV